MAIAINGSGTITGVSAGGLPDNTIDNGSMADDAIGVAELSATGTASSSTFLRGDNAWGTPSGGKILQVVANNVTGTSETTLDYYDGDMTDFKNIAALNTTITTTAANSNILVNLQFCGEPSNDDVNCRWVVSRTISGTITYFVGASPGNKVPCTGVLIPATYQQQNTSSVHPQTGLINYFDDIGTVAAGTAVEYKLSIESGNGGITYNLNKNHDDTDNAGHERTISYMTLMEVAG